MLLMLLLLGDDDTGRWVGRRRQFHGDVVWCSMNDFVECVFLGLWLFPIR